MDANLIAKAAVRISKLQESQRYENSLIDFSEYVWPVVEPAIPFVKGWAIEAIAEHLEAVTFGQIRRLLINVPPGFTKSLLTDVFWPAWEWGPRNMPTLRYMCAAYSNHLTERDNMRCRNIVISDRYKRLWGNRFKISNEQFTKIKFANDRTGWKLATSVGGIGTGERADRVIIDDPNNPMEMESEAFRNTTNMWFTEVIPDRLNNPRESAIVIIQQRTHEDDVSGIALSREMGYTHLMIPMEHDTKRHCVTVMGVDEEGEDIIWEDPRTEDGELAWPERFPAEICKELERDKGPYAWASQYLQTPEPRGGSIIKDYFWQLWKEDKFPSFEYILASLDTAYTTKEENDPSAMTIWGVFRDESGNPKMMLIWAWQERLEFHDLFQRVMDTCTISPAPKSNPGFPVDRLIIEAKASGMSVGQELYRLLRGTGKLGVELIVPKGSMDKVARVQSIQHLFADEMIYAPDKSWADMVIRQCASFPRGSHDDLCFVAGTMIATKRGSVPIEAIRIGDHALTPIGWRKVSAAGFTGVRPVIHKFGLVGTPNHPIFTVDSGYQALDSVSQASQLSRLTLCGLTKLIRQMKSNSMASSIDVWVEQGDTTSVNQKVMKDAERPRDCMSQSGSIITGRSQKVMKFIIKTAIPLIAALIIWSAYRRQSIVQCLKYIVQNSWNISLGFAHLLLPGIDHQRALIGIENMPLNLSKNQGKSHINRQFWEGENAFGAEHHSSLRPKAQNSARLFANIKKAAGGSKDINFTIHTMRPVFNLTVEDSHCYYANGILVHNCDSMSQALRYLRDCGFALRRDEQSMASEDELMYRSPSATAALYPI